MDEVHEHMQRMPPKGFDFDRAKQIVMNENPIGVEE
jgi:hypothetical protein